MNLEAIQKHLRAVTRIEWAGHVLYLRKIGATDGIEIFTSIKKLSGEDRSAHDDMVETTKFNAKVISKSLSNEDGELPLDSEDGRLALENMNFIELTELGEIVLRHSGYGGGAKKNTTQTSLPLSGSVEPSEAQNAPTPNGSLAG